MVIVCGYGGRNAHDAFKIFAEKTLDLPAWKTRFQEQHKRGEAPFRSENGTRVSPPNDDMQSFLLAKSRAGVSVERFSGAHVWHPSVFGLTLSKVRKLCAPHTPNNAMSQIIPGWGVARDKFTGVVPRIQEQIFQDTTALILAGGMGSPHHIDFIDWHLTTEYQQGYTESTSRDWELQIGPTDAWAVNIAGRKWAHTVDRFTDGVDRLFDWAHELGIYQTANQQRVCALGKLRMMQGPFQGVNSVGWPTIGQFLALEDMFRVPAHLHNIESGDGYMLRRGAPHLFLNSEFACSVAGDNLLEGSLVAGPPSWIEQTWTPMTRGHFKKFNSELL